MLSNEFFYCSNLTDATDTDKDNIRAFAPTAPTGEGLASYLRYYAFPEEDGGMMRTYLVKDLKTDELVGYFSLKAGGIFLNENNDDGVVSFDVLPGVELANFALDKTYRDKHSAIRGYGKIIFNDLIVPIIQEVSKAIGVYAIYLYALPYDDLMNRYIEYGFKRLNEEAEKQLHARQKPRYDQNCIFMYMRL